MQRVIYELLALVLIAVFVGMLMGALSHKLLSANPSEGNNCGILDLQKPIK